MGAVTICDTCKLYWMLGSMRDNNAASRTCIDAGHDLYASGLPRLELPSLRNHRQAGTPPAQMSLFDEVSS